MSEIEYRIEYQIQRRSPDDDDFVEIGFGSSGAWGDLDACTRWIASGVDHGEWETEPHHPDPDDVMAEQSEASHERHE